MVKKKIVMLGAFAVGKTSLVQRFVRSIFSEKYHTTIGVKIDEKTVIVGDIEVKIILWDIHGEDEFQKVKKSYIMGSSGYIMVADGTRKNTFNTVEYLHDLAVSTVGEVPFLFLINKSDLTDEWDIEDSDIDKIKAKGWNTFITSAKTGNNVEEAFRLLAELMVKAK